MRRQNVAAIVAIAAFFTLIAVPVTVDAQTVDEPVDLGSVTIVSETREALTDGKGSTVFGLLLPSGASCPGDSRNDQWRVQTFIVPAAIDPGTLSYNSVGPEGEGMYALYGLDTNPITAVLTGPNGAPGLPGLIIGLRAASFEIFPPGTLADGTYRVGAACTFFGETASFWDTEFQISRDTEDKPAEIRWEVTTAPVGAIPELANDPGTNSGSFAAVVAGVLAIVAIAVFVVRRSRRSPLTYKEMS